MLELVNNTATAVTLFIAVSIPLFTLFDMRNSTSVNRKIQVQQQHSILELPLNTSGYPPEDLQKIENLNFELHGLVTVFALPRQE